MKKLSAKTALGILSLGLFAVGIWDVLLNFEKNLCQMTYMFELPNYVPVSLNDSVVEDFPNYGLYVYGEGARTAQYQRNIFKGIPVLFIPGNAGSYRQARSLGSVLLRMSEKRQNGVRFDVFTVDFNEEFAGLYGGFLATQTDFVLQCLLKISSLYGKTEKKIILVGHSVGGIIARGLFLNPSFETSSVNTIFTLSTPHQPVLIVDAEFEEFYENIDFYWSKNADSVLKNVVMVSLAGGHRDVLVRSDRSDLSKIFEKKNFEKKKSEKNGRFLSMTTTSIPSVWASTDHLCIVWCKQLVITLAKSFFEMVDIKTKQGLFDDVEKRTEIVWNYFMNPTSKVTLNQMEKIENRSIANVRFEKNGPLRILAKKFQPVSYHAFPLEDVEGDVVVLSNRWMRKWISFCRDSACNERISVSVKPTRFPFFSENSHFFSIFPKKILKNGKFLLFEIPKSDDVISLQVEKTPEMEDVPSISFAMTFFGSKKKWKISEKSFFRIKIELEEIWESLNVDVSVSGKCSSDRGVVRFSVPGFVQDTYKLLSHPENKFPLKIQSEIFFEKKNSEKNFEKKFSDETFSLLEFFLNPECTYEIDFEIAWTDIFGQFIRFYSVQIPAFFAAVVVVQLAPLYRKKTSTILDHLFLNAVVALFILAVWFFSNLTWLSIGFAGASLPTSCVLWVICYTVTYFMVSLFEMALSVMVSLYSYPVHYLAKPVLVGLRLLQNKTPGWSQKIFVFPVFAVAATGLSYATCGENGILLALLLYFIKICYHKRNQLVSTSVTCSSDVGESTKILLLAVLVTMCNVVPTLVWTKRLPVGLLGLFKSSYSRLDPDPSFAIAVVAGIVLDLSNRSHTRRAILTRASNFMDFLMLFVIFIVAAGILTFAQKAFYMVNFFLSILLTVMSCDFMRKAFTDSQPPAKNV